MHDFNSVGLMHDSLSEPLGRLAAGAWLAAAGSPLQDRLHELRRALRGTQVAVRPGRQLLPRLDPSLALTVSAYACTWHHMQAVRRSRRGDQLGRARPIDRYELISYGRPGTAAPDTYN